MKKASIIFLCMLLLGCSTTRVTESWRNPEYEEYQPIKVLMLGMTSNLAARKMYEEKLKSAFIQKGILATESYKIIKTSFTNLKQSEQGVEKQIDTLSNIGYDAVLISAVKGYEERISYSGELFEKDHNLGKLGPYYYLYQEVYFDDTFHEQYKVYHIEISLYDLTNKSEKSLVWVASYDIIDPQKLNSTIKDCVKAIVTSLEEEGILPLK